MKQLLLSLLLLLPVVMYAQTADTAEGPKGTLSGKIKNEKEEPVPEAMAFVYNGTDILGSGTTDATGWFQTNRIVTGTYTVKVVFKGYKKSIVTDVLIKLNRDTEIGIKIFPQADTDDTTAVYSSFNIVAVKKPVAEAAKRPTRKK